MSRLGRNPFQGRSETSARRVETMTPPETLAERPAPVAPPEPPLTAQPPPASGAQLRDHVIEVATVIVASGMIAYTLARDWAKNRSETRNKPR